MTTSLVQEVISNTPLDCHANICKGGECSVSMEDAPSPFMLLDMDCATLPIDKTANRCDFIFISDAGNWVVPIELKEGNPRVAHLARQLQKGAEFADQVVPDDTDVQFLAVAAFGGKLHRMDARRLRNPIYQIQFRGRYATIEMLACGQALNDALGEGVNA